MHNQVQLIGYVDRLSGGGVNWAAWLLPVSGDKMGSPQYGFVLATGFAVVLFPGLALNWVFNPTLRVFRQVDETEYILLAILLAKRE